MATTEQKLVKFGDVEIGLFQTISNAHWFIELYIWQLNHVFKKLVEKVIFIKVVTTGFCLSMYLEWCLNLRFGVQGLLCVNFMQVCKKVINDFFCYYSLGFWV
jgi:hypothetical protein